MMGHTTREWSMKRTSMAGLAIIALIPWTGSVAALGQTAKSINAVSYTHLRAHET